MPDIHISIRDVERVRSELRAAEKSIQASIKKVESTLRSADWADPNRREFERKLGDATRPVTTFTTSGVGELDAYLNKVIAQAKALGAG